MDRRGGLSGIPVAEDPDRDRALIAVARPTPFEVFIRPALRRPELWRLLLGLAVIAASWFGASLFLPIALMPLTEWIPPKAASTLIVLYFFLVLIVGATLAARMFQGRGLSSMIGPVGFRPCRCIVAATCVFGVTSFAGAFLFRSYPVSEGVAPLVWVALLPLGLVGVFIQSSAEEIVFRGYLMQSLAARFRTRIVWLIAPAALFGALHWDAATHGPNAWLVALSAGVVGVILGDVTARCGDLSPAIGLHFANNVVALLLLAPDTPFSGLSLFVIGLDTEDLSGMRSLLLADLALMVCLYGLWFAIWGRHRRLHSGGAEPI